MRLITHRFYSTRPFPYLFLQSAFIKILNEPFASKPSVKTSKLLYLMIYSKCTYAEGLSKLVLKIQNSEFTLILTFISLKSPFFLELKTLFACIPTLPLCRSNHQQSFAALPSCCLCPLLGQFISPSSLTKLLTEPVTSAVYSHQGP